MAIFRDVTINWKGTAHVVSPSVAMLRSIERKDVSLTDIAARTAQGAPPLSHIASAIARMLQWVKVDVTEDEVFAEILSASEKDATALVEVVLMAFMPVTVQEAEPAKPSKKKRDR